MALLVRPCVGEITFATRQEVHLPAAVRALSIVKLNTDAMPDALVASDRGIEVLLGTASGWFSTPLLIRRQPVPNHLAAADFDGDGRVDVAVAGTTEAAVSVWFGNGSGSFEPGPTLPLPGRVLELQAADVDRDGREDLLAGWKEGIVVWLGNPQRSFSEPRHADTNGAPGRAFRTADLDGDGRTDLVLLETGGEGVGFFRGNGDGGFTPTSVSLAGVEPRALPAPRDFDGDQLLDLAVVDARGLSILRGNGKGGFHAPQRLVRSDDLGGVLTLDWDQDGLFDLVVTDSRRALLHILHNTGRANFASLGEFSLAAQPTSLAAADFDSDGHPEVVIGSALGRSLTRIGNRAGTPLGVPAFDVGPDPGDAVAFDADGDGRLDLAVAQREEGAVRVFLASGEGAFSQIFRQRTGNDPRAVIAADFNGDGKPDLAVANYGSDDVAVLLGSSGGKFTPPLLLSTGLGPTGLAAADFDGDGNVDLATANTLSQSVSVFWGDGAGRFPHSTNLPTLPRPVFVLAGDVDHDGRVDLVTGTLRDDQIHVFYGREGSLGEAAQPGTFRAPVRPVVGADFDGDGYTDVVRVDTSSDRVAVFPGTGGTNLGAPRYFATGRQPTTAVPGDFDGDGRPDLLILHRRIRTALLLRNTTAKLGGERAQTPAPIPLSADPWQATMEPW